MPKPPQPPESLAPANLQRATPSVNLDQLSASLRFLLSDLAQLHLYLFNRPLVVTSGNDGTHAKGSKHYTNQAADLRSRDKTPEEQLIFGSVLAFVANRYNVAIFDERARDAAPHWHLEVAD